MDYCNRQAQFVLHSIHIDAARNSTDDFNLFHDKQKWHQIRNNPFQGPIALGFQLESLIAEQINCYRKDHQEQSLIEQHGLHFSNFQFNFTNVIKPDEQFTIDIKKSRLTESDNTTLSNRVALKGEQGIALIGYKKESQAALFHADMDFSNLPPLRQAADREHINDGEFFYKRKFMNNGNAKNFLSGSLTEQAIYFDELEDRVQFPETFPVALISCALLEKAQKEGHDFKNNPMVYTYHHISLDRRVLAKMKSNTTLHMLVSQPQHLPGEKGLGKSSVNQHTHHCFGLLDDHSLLYRAEIGLAPLEEITKA